MACVGRARADETWDPDLTALVREKMNGCKRLLSRGPHGRRRLRSRSRCVFNRRDGDRPRPDREDDVDLRPTRWCSTTTGQRIVLETSLDRTPCRS